MSSKTSANTAQLERPTRQMPIGAEVVEGGGVHFRVWAPKRSSVQVIFEDKSIPPVPLEKEADGYYAGHSPEAKAGALYRFKLDDEDYLYPDPASRYQPDGPHGPSQVVDSRTFKWTDKTWKGVTAHGQVLYELHIGTFTKDGTWASAMERLEDLADVGITCLEVMPANEFIGRFGWGYDGVAQYAPFHHYGTPDDMRRFIDRAHELGIGVILDLVYNHLGPDGNYLPSFSDKYMSEIHGTDWGDALNYDGDQSAPVREYFVQNAVYWVREFHMDGFRFDATQAIVDESPKHVLAEISEQTRKAAGSRSIYIINENEPQQTKLVRPISEGGYGMDGLWNDDFHHSAVSAVSGHNEAYYTDHPGTAQELLSAAKYGYIYQGQRYAWQKKRRGTPTFDLAPTAFVHFLQNHDQIANSGRGYRLHQITSPGEYKAITALLLLMPQTPMLFQGQEWAASNTFHYFADHNPDLAKLVHQGRIKEIGQFPSAAADEMLDYMLDPSDPSVFERSKLDHDERHKHPHNLAWKLHKDLIKLRKTDPAFNHVPKRGDMDGAIIGPKAFVMRYFIANDEDRLLIFNLDGDIHFDRAPEPLLAPPLGKRWTKIFSTEDPGYGGSGTPPLDTEKEGWFIPGRCAVVLKPLPAEQGAVETRIKQQGSAQEAKKKKKD